MPSQSLVAPDAASLGFELAHAILDSNRLFQLRLSSQNLGQFPLAWYLANPILTSVIIGPRTWDQDADNLGLLRWSGPLRMNGPWMRWPLRQSTGGRGFQTRLIPCWDIRSWTEEPGRAPLRDILTIPQAGCALRRATSETADHRDCRSQRRGDSRVGWSRVAGREWLGGRIGSEGRPAAVVARKPHI